MTDEKKREYTLRITQAGPKGLTILLYEITECYLQEAEEAFARKEPEQFRDAVHKAQKCLTVCRSSLDRTQPLSAVLLPLYVNLHAMLSRALTRKRVTEVQETAQMIAQLREAYEQTGDSGEEEPLMEHTQQVYAGLTYGRHCLVENVADTTPNRGYRI